jgi:hypothetical protein
MIRLLVAGRLQTDLGRGTVPTSLWAVDANGSAHAAATKVDAVMKGMATVLASFLKGNGRHVESYLLKG